MEMNSKELSNILEAYSQVYEQVGVKVPANATDSEALKGLIPKGNKIHEVPRKTTLQQAHYEPEGLELTEEVEIAAHYFYEMGLNEDGVDILIEELGVEEFAEFVYDIAEEYVLTEARAGGVKIEPVSKTGKPYKGTKKAPGKPPEKRIEELRTKKAERKSAENEASESKPSGLKASLQRQSAVAAASKKQPKKPGLLDRVAGAVNKGIERHNAAMSAARETGKTIRKAAGHIGGVAREVGKGASGAAKLAGHVARKGLNDEYIVGYLIDEGYAETEESAFKILENMSEEWRESIFEAKYGTASGRKKLAKKIRKGKEVGKSGPGTGFASVEKAAKRGGATDPKAVAAAAMWKTYGK